MSNFLMSEKRVKPKVSSLKKKLINFMRTLQHVPSEAKSDMQEVIALLEQDDITILPTNAEREVSDYIDTLFHWYPSLAQYNKESSEQLKRSAKTFALKAVEERNKEVNNKRNLT